MWLALTLLSFVALLASVFGVARLGFDARGRFLPAGRWLILGAVCSFSVWLFSLARVAPPYPVENVKRYVMPD